MGFDTEGAKNRKPKTLNIYVPPNKTKVVAEAKAYFKRENSKESISSFVMDQLTSLVALHGKGNNQQLIIRYLTHTTPYIAPRKCIIHHCPNPASTTGIFIETQSEFPLCSNHAKSYEQQKGWKITNKPIGV